MTSSSGDRSPNGDMPWATVFDPAANARALGAIQAEGFRAASRIVDRFATLTGAKDDETSSHTVTMGDSTGGRAKETPSVPDLEQLTRAWWSAAGQFLLGVNGARSAGRSEFDLETPSRGDGVALRATAPGRTSCEVWLHNRGAKELGDVRLRCSDLLGHNGDVIRASEVTLKPPVVPMPPRSSRGVIVEVVVSEHFRPGTYRGNLLVDGHDGLWLPVTLVVCPQAS